MAQRPGDPDYAEDKMMGEMIDGPEEPLEWNLPPMPHARGNMGNGGDSYGNDSSYAPQRRPQSPFSSTYLVGRGQMAHSVPKTLGERARDTFNGLFHRGE